jgi:ribosomal protein S18 acetylase RimI-like enzyme
VFETWRYGRGDDHDLPTAELLAVAVDDGTRGRGVGHALVRELNDEFARRGTAAVKVVVGADNDGALRLYRDCGYEDAASIEVHHDVASKVLVWSRSSH